MQPCSGLLINGGNVQGLSSFIHSSYTTDGRNMRFVPGTAYEMLLEVPLVGMGQLNMDTTIRITVGRSRLPQNPLVTDNEPRVGLSDGNTVNDFHLEDPVNYDSTPPSLPPCKPVAGIHDNTLVSNNSPLPNQYTLLFKPYSKYGACYTAQDGGYVNTAEFTNQMIITQPLSLVLHGGDEPNEGYTFHYFLVEILQNN